MRRVILYTQRLYRLYFRRKERWYPGRSCSPEPVAPDSSVEEVPVSRVSPPRRLFHFGLPVGNAALLEEELHELGRLIGHDAARDLEGVVGVLGTRKTAHAALDGTEPRVDAVHQPVNAKGSCLFLSVTHMLQDSYT